MRFYKFVIFACVLLFLNVNVFAMLDTEPKVSPVTFENLRFETHNFVLVRAIDINANKVLWDKKFFTGFDKRGYFIEDGGVVNNISINNEIVKEQS